MEPFHQRINYRTDHIKHEVSTVKYLREVYSRGFLGQPFAHKESFSKDGTDCFSSAREQITITGSKFLDGWVAKEIIFTSRARAYNDFRGYWMEKFLLLDILIQFLKKSFVA